MRLGAHAVLLATSWLATEALMHLDIHIPGLPSLQDLGGGAGPYPELDRLLQEEVQ